MIGQGSFGTVVKA
jgi:mitogen-activated protein kinase 1/3